MKYTYIYIRFKNGATAAYNLEELKVTKGFIKIIDSTYGNIAIPRDEIISFTVNL